MNNIITFWGAGTSRTLRPVWVAEELDIPYKLEPIGPRTGETQTPEYISLNPKQKIPLLVDGDFRLTESLAISRYLINTYPGEAIYRPATPVEQAREDEWCCYIYGELDESSLYIMRRHGDLGYIYGDSPVVVASAADYARRHLQLIEQHLEQREFVLSEGFGLADIMLMTCLTWARAYGIDLSDGSAAYCERISQRDAYQRALAANFDKSR